MFLGKMDPKTGKVTQYPIPVTKPGWPLGSLDLEVDRDDNVWLGMMYQASIVRFDQKTETFKVWSIPKEWDSEGAQFGHLAVNGTHVDGKVWVKNSDGTKIYRLDLATDKWEDLGAPSDPRTKRRIGTYGIHSDTATNDAYLLDFAAGNIVKIDAKTKETTIYLTPTPNSTPRRGRVDAEGRVWFAEYRADRIGMLDPKTAQIIEWKVPTTWSAPYDAMFSRHGHAWTGSMVTDRVARLDIETGQYTEYTLPRPTNIRRVFVDDRSNPGHLWIGSNHGAIDRQGRAAGLAEINCAEKIAWPAFAPAMRVLGRVDGRRGMASSEVAMQRLSMLACCAAVALAFAAPAHAQTFKQVATHRNPRHADRQLRRADDRSGDRARLSRRQGQQGGRRLRHQDRQVRHAHHRLCRHDQERQCLRARTASSIVSGGAELWVSDGDFTIKVVDLKTHTITSTIADRRQAARQRHGLRSQPQGGDRRQFQRRGRRSSA